MKITKLLICSISAMLLAGCMTEEIVKTRAVDSRVTLLDNSSFKLGLLSSQTVINENGLLEVNAKTVISRTSYWRWLFTCDPTLHIWYIFTWIDKEGKLVSSKQTELLATPGAIVDFHAIAPAEKYISYHLSVSLNGVMKQEEIDARRKKYIEDFKKSHPNLKIEPAASPKAHKVLNPNSSVEKKAAKPAPKAAAKPVAKPAPKTTAKPVAKPAPKTTAKSVAKPAAKPEIAAPAKQAKITEPYN